VKAFQRKKDDDERPTSMTFDGTAKSGLDIVEWSRDPDTSARFQYRPELPDEPARVLLVDPVRQWVIVPVGAVIHINSDGDLELEISQPEEPKTEEAPAE
jgi:predicted ATP-binding protein involved in virulence